MAIRDGNGHLIRDPLSEAYDTPVRQMLVQAIRQLRNHQRGPIAWIASPRHEFRQLDKGGLTRHEREFIRAAYFQVFKVPRKTGAPVHYSMTYEVDRGRREPSAYGRLARPVRLTLHRHGVRGPGGGAMPPPGTWVGFQSTEGNRIDS